MEYLFEPQEEHGRLFEIEFVQAKNQANKLSGGHPRVPTSCLSIRHQVLQTASQKKIYVSA